jgi:hypothetical protein
MRNAPFTIALREEHGEARRSGHRLAILHSGKFIEPGNDDGVVAKHNGPPFTDGIRVTTGRSKIFGDGLRPLRDNGTYRAEQDRVGRVEFYQRIAVIGAIGCRPFVDEPVCILCRTCDGPPTPSEEAIQIEFWLGPYYY